MLNRPILCVLFILSAILLTTESYAQWGGTSGSGIPGMQGSRRAGGRMNSNNPDSSTSSQNSHIGTTPASNLLTYEQIEMRLSALETNLKLSPEQNKIWETFASKVRIYASDVAKERARFNADAAIIPLDGLKYINQSQENAKSRYVSLKDVDDSAKPLYKILTAEQKSVFDTSVSEFIAATPKRLGANQPSYNLPDLGGNSSPTRSQP